MESVIARSPLSRALRLQNQTNPSAPPALTWGPALATPTGAEGQSVAPTSGAAARPASTAHDVSGAQQHKCVAGEHAFDCGGDGNLKGLADLAREGKKANELARATRLHWRAPSAQDPAPHHPRQPNGPSAERFCTENHLSVRDMIELLINYNKYVNNRLYVKFL